MSYSNQPYPYGPSHGVPQQTQQRSTNGLAIGAFIFAFVFAPVGLVLGYMARSEIRRTGEGGAGIAMAALIISWVVLAMVALAFLLCLGLLILFPILLGSAVHGLP